MTFDESLSLHQGRRERLGGMVSKNPFGCEVGQLLPTQPD